MPQYVGVLWWGSIVRLKAFKITKGALQHYAISSLAGGNNLRGFCAKFGSRLIGAQIQEKESSA